MKGTIISSAIHGFLVVALGAFGAHALEAILDEYSIGIWNTAVQYQMFHAAALLGIGILSSHNLAGSKKQLKIAAVCMNVGIIFFAGSLYILALSGVTILGAITPIGGVFFLAGWIFLIVGIAKHKN